jgi:hypothetical protein
VCLQKVQGAQRTRLLVAPGCVVLPVLSEAEDSSATLLMPPFCCYCYEHTQTLWAMNTPRHCGQLVGGPSAANNSVLVVVLHC